MRLTTTVVAATAAALVTLASPAGAQSPPQLPDIPNLPNIPKAKVERFQMTIRGLQTGDFKFTWTPGNVCGWHAEGSLTEGWEYARGKAVVMEFTRLGRGVLLRRVGRPPGDAAFASPGHVTRGASGFFDMGPEGCGGIHSLVSPDCGEPGETLNFQGLSFPYPLFHRQTTKFPARKIFGRSRGFQLHLKAKFLEPLRDGTWGDSSESLRGTTLLTFKRLRDR